MPHCLLCAPRLSLRVWQESAPQPAAGHGIIWPSHARMSIRGRGRGSAWLQDIPCPTCGHQPPGSPGSSC